MGTSRSISSLVVGVVSSAYGPACTSNDIQIVDLHADFRDIWAGRETAETGKQADPNVPVVVVAINHSWTRDLGPGAQSHPSHTIAEGRTRNAQRRSGTAPAIAVAPQGPDEHVSLDLLEGLVAQRKQVALDPKCRRTDEVARCDHRPATVSRA